VPVVVSAARDHQPTDHFYIVTILVPRIAAAWYLVAFGCFLLPEVDLQLQLFLPEVVDLCTVIEEV
jgi:hypothetical protein